MKFIGIRRNIATSNTNWERIEASVGKVANAVTSEATINTTVNNFDNIFPWSDIKTCSLNKDGSVKAYLEEPSFNWNDDYIMTEIPGFWWNREQKVENGATWEYIYISKIQTDFTPYYSKKFYIGRYTATGSSSAITTKSASNNLVNVTITNFRKAAQSIGAGWGIQDIFRLSMIQMLYLVEYADYNSQKIIGNGVSKASSAVKTGTLNNLKMKSGYLSNDKAHAVIYRGIENIYANIIQLTDGINFTSAGAIWICTDRTKYTDSKFESPYIKLNDNFPSSNNYIKELGYDFNFPMLQLPKTLGGTTTTYITDYSYTNKANGCLRFGGHADNDLIAGLWYFNGCNNPTSTGTNIGTRLMYIPPYTGELENVLFTGTEYIDTEIKPNQDTKIEIKYQATSDTDAFICGSRTSLDNNDKIAHFSHPTQLDYQFNTYKGQTNETRPAGILTVTIGKDGGYLNGVKKFTYDTVTNFQGNFSIYIGGINQSGSLYLPAKIQVYSFKIWQGDKLILDLIPYSANDTICFKDNISSKYFNLQTYTGCCLAAGTLIDTINGEVPVEELKKGDRVYSYNFDTEEIEIDEIENTSNRLDTTIYNIQLEDSTIVRVTDNHQFYTYIKEIDNYDFILARYITVGDYLFNKNKELVKITNIEIEYTEKQIVYDITTKNNHNYYISSSNKTENLFGGGVGAQILVHNAAGC